MIESIIQDLQIDSFNLNYYNSPMTLFILLPFLYFEKLTFSINDGYEILIIIIKGFIFYFEIISKYSLIKNVDGLFFNIISSIISYFYIFPQMIILNYISILLFLISLYYYQPDIKKPLFKM